MPLTQTVRPHTRALTTLARIWSEFKITTADEQRDAHINELILEASDMIMKEIGRDELFRARITETVVGAGRAELLLTRTPIAKIESVTIDDTPIDLELVTFDPNVGLALHDTAWPNTRHFGSAVTRFERPDEGAHRIAVDYWAGVFGPAEDIQASGISVFGGSESFAVDDPPLLVAGDVIETVGFTNAANNGQFVVTARTASGIEVDGDLATETAPASARIKVRTLDRALERACVQTIKSWILGVEHDPNVTSERIGDWAATYAGSNANEIVHEIPASVLKVLDKFRRYV